MEPDRGWRGRRCEENLPDGASPGTSLLWKLALGSLASLVIGSLMFRVLHRRFYDHL